MKKKQKHAIIICIVIIVGLLITTSYYMFDTVDILNAFILFVIFGMMFCVPIVAILGETFDKSSR